ncbi:hypothetical protein GF327_09900 [Candidatus Woesearchaeota archaeon]|nr:hypothetical protein [Candidatus Woesearchaeota archaeon]
MGGKSVNIDYKSFELKTKAGIDYLYSSYINSLQYEKLHAVSTALLDNNSHNPFLKNSLKLFFFKIDSEEKINNIKKNKLALDKIHHLSSKEISEFGVKKIKKGSCIFIPYLSYEIDSILNTLKKRNRKFSINTIEHRPFKSGEIIKDKFQCENIRVNVFHDLFFSYALKNCDLCMIPAMAYINEEYVVYPGTEAISVSAKKRHVPVYVCASAFKSADKITIESLLQQRIIKDKGEHPKYEIMTNENIHGVITETGIYPSDHITEEHERFFQKLFKSFPDKFL